MHNHKLLDLSIVIHLRNAGSFFYTKDERQAILRSAWKSLHA